MPFTGRLTIRQHGKEKVYSAAIAGEPEWVKTPYGFSDGTHVNFKPTLGVRVRVLANQLTPPKKFLVAHGGKIPALNWIKTYWVPKGQFRFEGPGVEVDWASAGPRPEGKGWGKGLKEVYQYGLLT